MLVTFVKKTCIMASSMKRHIRTAHFKELRYNCDICLKDYTSFSELKLHKMSIHEKVTENKCHFCSKYFQKPNKLKHHIFKVHEN